MSNWNLLLGSFDGGEAFKQTKISRNIQLSHNITSRISPRFTQSHTSHSFTHESHTHNPFQRKKSYKGEKL